MAEIPVAQRKETDEAARAGDITKLAGFLRNHPAGRNWRNITQVRATIPRIAMSIMRGGSELRE